MVKFASNFCYCAVDQEKTVQWKRAVSGPCALFGARNGQICTEFLLLCSIPRKTVFQWKRAVSGPCALGPEMVKFAPNFCCCAVSGPSAFLGPEMVKFATTLAKPSVEGPCRALHAEGYPLPERIPKMIGHEG